MNSMNEAVSWQEAQLQATQILSPRHAVCDEPQAVVAIQRVSSHVLGITFNSSQQLQQAGPSKLSPPNTPLRLTTQPLQLSKMQAVLSPNVPKHTNSATKVLFHQHMGNGIPGKGREAVQPANNITMKLFSTPSRIAIADPDQDHSHSLLPTQILPTQAVEDEPVNNQMTQPHMDAIPPTSCQDAPHVPDTGTVAAQKKAAVSNADPQECAEGPVSCHDAAAETDLTGVAAARPSTIDDQHRSNISASKAPMPDMADKDTCQDKELVRRNNAVQAAEVLISSDTTLLMPVLPLGQTGLPNTPPGQPTVNLMVTDKRNEQHMPVSITDNIQPETLHLLQKITADRAQKTALPVVSGQDKGEGAVDQQPAELAQDAVTIPVLLHLSGQTVNNSVTGQYQIQCVNANGTDAVIETVANAKEQQKGIVNSYEHHERAAVITGQQASMTPNAIQTNTAAGAGLVEPLTNNGRPNMDVVLRSDDTIDMPVADSTPSAQARAINMQEDFGRLRLGTSSTDSPNALNNAQTSAADDTGRALNVENTTSSKLVDAPSHIEQHGNQTSTVADAAGSPSGQVPCQILHSTDNAKQQETAQHKDQATDRVRHASTTQPAADRLAPYRLLMSKLNSGFIAGHEKAALASTILTMSAKCIVAVGMGELKEGADANALLNNVQCMELAARQQLDLLNFSYSLNTRPAADNHSTGSPLPAVSIHGLGMGDLAGISQRIRIGSDEVAELRTETPLSISSPAAAIRQSAGSWQGVTSPPGSNAPGNDAADDLADISDGECMYYIKRASKITSRLTYQQYKEHSARRGSMTPSRSGTPLSSSPATPYTSGLSSGDAAIRTPTNISDVVIGSLFNATPKNACNVGSKLNGKASSPPLAPQHQSAENVCGEDLQQHHAPASSPAKVCKPLPNAATNTATGVLLDELQTPAGRTGQIHVSAQAAVVQQPLNQQPVSVSCPHKKMQSHVLQKPMSPIHVGLPSYHDRANTEAVTPTTKFRTAAAKLIMSPNRDPSKGSAGRGTTSSLDKTLSRTALATSSEDDQSLRGPSAVSRALKKPLAMVSTTPGLNSAQLADRLEHGHDGSQSQCQILTLAAGVPSASPAPETDARNRRDSNTPDANTPGLEGNTSTGLEEQRRAQVQAGVQDISVCLFGDVGSSTQPVIRAADSELRNENSHPALQPTFGGGNANDQHGSEQPTPCLVGAAEPPGESQDTMDGVVPASITSQDERDVAGTVHAGPDKYVHSPEGQQQGGSLQHAQQQQKHAQQPGLMGPPPPRLPRVLATVPGQHAAPLPSPAQQSMGIRLSQVEMTQNETQTDPETLPVGRPASAQVAEHAADMGDTCKVPSRASKEKNRDAHAHHGSNVTQHKKQTAQQRSRMSYPPAAHTVPRRKNPSLTVAERNAAMQRQAAQLASIAAPIWNNSNVELSPAAGTHKQQPNNDTVAVDKQKVAASKPLSPTGRLMKRNRESIEQGPDPYRYPDTQEHELPQEDPPMVCRKTRPVSLVGSADSNDVSIAGSQPGLRSKQRLLITESAETQENVDQSSNVLHGSAQAPIERNHADEEQREQQDRVSKRRRALLGEAVGIYNTNQVVGKDQQNVVALPADTAKDGLKGAAFGVCKATGTKHRPVRSTRKPAGFYKQLDGSNSQADVAGTQSQAGESSIQPEELQDEEEGENDDDIWSSLRLLDSSDEENDGDGLDEDEAAEEQQVEEQAQPTLLHEVIAPLGHKQPVVRHHCMAELLNGDNVDSNIGHSTPNTGGHSPMNAKGDPPSHDLNNVTQAKVEGSKRSQSKGRQCAPSATTKANTADRSAERAQGQQKRKLGCSKCRYSSAGCLKCRATGNRPRQPSRTSSSPGTGTLMNTPSNNLGSKPTTPSHLTSSKQHTNRIATRGAANSKQDLPSLDDMDGGTPVTAAGVHRQTPGSSKPGTVSILGKRSASDEGQTEFQEMLARTKRSRSLGIFGGLKFLLTGQLHPSKCSKTDRAGIREELAQKIIYNGGTLVTDLPEVHVPWLSAGESPNAKGQRAPARRRSLDDSNPHGDASEFPDVVITDDIQATCRLLSCIARGAAVLTSSWLLTSLHELRVIEPGLVGGGMLVHPPRSHLKAAGPLTGLNVLVAGTPKFCRSFGAALAHAGAVLAANLPHRRDLTATPAHLITRAARSVFWTSASPTRMAQTNPNQEPTSHDKHTTLHLVVLEDECLLDNPANADNMKTGRGRNSGPLKPNKSTQRQAKTRDAGGLSSQDPASPDMHDALAPKLATLQRSAKAMGIPVRGRDWVEQVLRQGQLPDDFFQLETNNVGEPSNTPCRTTRTTIDIDIRDCRTPAAKSPVRSPLRFPSSLLETSSSPSAAIAQQTSPMTARQAGRDHHHHQQAQEEHQQECEAHDSQAMQGSEFSFGFLGRDACSQQLLPHGTSRNQQACHVCTSPQSPVHTPTRSKRTQDIPCYTDNVHNVPCLPQVSAETLHQPASNALQTHQQSPSRRSLIEPEHRQQHHHQQQQQQQHQLNGQVLIPATKGALNLTSGNVRQDGADERAQPLTTQQSPHMNGRTKVIPSNTPSTPAVEIQGLLPEVPAPQGNLHTHYSGILLDNAPVRLGECIEMHPWAGEQLPCVVRVDRVWSHPLPGGKPRWYASVTRLCFPQATEFNMMSPGAVPMLYLTPDRIERLNLATAVRRVRVVMGMMAAAGQQTGGGQLDYICNFEYNPDTMMLAPVMVTQQQQQQPITG